MPVDAHDGLHFTPQELNAPEFMPRAVELMFTLMFDCTKEKEHMALIDLLVQLCKRNGCTKDDLVAGMKTQVCNQDQPRIDLGF